MWVPCELKFDLLSGKFSIIQKRMTVLQFDVFLSHCVTAKRSGRNVFSITAYEINCGIVEI